MANFITTCPNFIGNRRFLCKFGESDPILEENYELTERTSPTTEHINIPEEIETLLSEYDEYHNKWIRRVKSYYKSEADKKPESLLVAMTTVT